MYAKIMMKKMPDLWSFALLGCLDIEGEITQENRPKMPFNTEGVSSYCPKRAIEIELDADFLTQKAKRTYPHTYFSGE
ncbi:MAG: hypothetical protein U5L45_00980 [Saprospiraceae bacterium]|nr:hypothetical protein [Saprospiraceae bacterium]